MCSSLDEKPIHMWGDCVRGQGKPNPGVDHDAIGEWKRWDPPTHPGYLGGASMARVNDGKLKGVLHFGGLLFPPNQPIGGARGLSTASRRRARTPRNCWFKSGEDSFSAPPQSAS